MSSFTADAHAIFGATLTSEEIIAVAEEPINEKEELTTTASSSGVTTDGTIRIRKVGKKRADVMLPIELEEAWRQAAPGCFGKETMHYIYWKES